MINFLRNFPIGRAFRIMAQALNLIATGLGWLFILLGLICKIKGGDLTLEIGSEIIKF